MAADSSMSPDLLMIHTPLPDCSMGCGRGASIREGRLLLCGTCACHRIGEPPPSIKPLPKIDRAKASRGFTE